MSFSCRHAREDWCCLPQLNIDEIKKLRRALEVTQEEKDRDSFLSGCLEVKPPNQKRKRNKGRREFQVDYYLSPIRDVREKLRCCQRAFLSVFFEISQRKINTIARTLFRTGGLSILKDKIEEIKFDGGHIQLINISEKKKRVIQETQKKKKAASTSTLSERKLTAAQATAEVVVIPSLTITDHLLEQQARNFDMNIGTVEVQVPFQLMQPSQINQDHPSMDNLQQLMNAQPMMHHHHHHHHVGESNQYLSLNMNLHETSAYVHHHSLQSEEDGMNASQSEVQAHTGLGGSHEESSSLREEEGSVHHQQHHLHQCEPHFAFNHDDGAGDSINESSQYMANAYLNQKKGQSTLSHSSKPCGTENNGSEGTETKHTEKRIRIHNKEAKNDKRKRKERKRKRREKEKRNSNHNRRRRTEEVDLLLRAAENGQQHFSEGLTTVSSSSSSVSQIAMSNCGDASVMLISEEVLSAKAALPTRPISSSLQQQQISSPWGEDPQSAAHLLLYEQAGSHSQLESIYGSLPESMTLTNSIHEHHIPSEHAIQTATGQCHPNIRHSGAGDSEEAAQMDRGVDDGKEEEPTAMIITDQQRMNGQGEDNDEDEAEEDRQRLRDELKSKEEEISRMRDRIRVLEEALARYSCNVCCRMCSCGAVGLVDGNNHQHSHNHQHNSLEQLQ